MSFLNSLGLKIKAWAESRFEPKNNKIMEHVNSVHAPIQTTQFTIFMDKGLMDFSAKNLNHRKWIFPDGTTSTAERPQYTMTRKGRVVLEGDFANSLQCKIDNTTGSNYRGKLSDLPDIHHFLRLDNCSDVTGDLTDLPNLSYYLNLYNCSNITGDLADLPNLSNYLILYDCSNITGDLADLPNLSSYLNLGNCIHIRGSLNPITSKRIHLHNIGCSSSEMDITLKNIVTAGQEGGTLDISKNTRTSNSDPAIKTLTDRGWSITDAVIEGVRQ